MFKPKCHLLKFLPRVRSVNITGLRIMKIEICIIEGGKYNLTDLPEVGSDAHRDIWQERLREVCSPLDR